jgi:hypothetical protein
MLSPGVVVVDATVQRRLRRERLRPTCPVRRARGDKTVPKLAFDGRRDPYSRRATPDDSHRRSIGDEANAQAPAERTGSMPSTLVHVAIGGLVGAALLASDFDARAIAVVFAATAFPDLDAFAGLVLPGAHRSLLHSLLLPTLVGALLLFDTVRTDSLLRRRFGGRGVRLAWVSLAALTFGGILPDMFTNGVNAFYPAVDAFYTVDGKLLLSDQRGLVQTFVELQPPERPEPKPSTETLHYSTPVDPSPGREPEDVERVAPVFQAGWELMLVVVSSVVVSVRLWDARRR